MEQYPRIVFLSPYDPRDPQRWSGTINSIFLALQTHDPKIQFISGGILDWMWRVAGRVFALFGIEADFRFSKPFGWLAGMWASVRLCMLKADVVVAVAASNYVAFIRTRKPIVYISDTTFAALEGLNPYFKKFPRWLRRHGDNNEQRTLCRARHVIYPSEWARLSAVKDYGVDDAKIHVMPFGPNFSAELLAQFRTVKAADFAGPLRILYVSTDWKLKSGDLVIEICGALRGTGLACEVFLVGRIPTTVQAGDGVHLVGFLDKYNPAHLARLCELYESAHFFIMPTTGDTYGIVFSEAQAFGCPSVTYDVGGTSSAVIDNETGIVLPLTATAADFARRIEQLVLNPVAYETMSRNARRRYEQCANWEAWARAITELASASASAKAQQSSHPAASF